MSEKLTRQQAIQTLITNGELPTEDKILELIGGTPTELLPQSELEKERIRMEVELASRQVDDIEPKVKIIDNPQYEPGKKKVEDFVKYYRNRYTYLKNILMSRPDTSDAISIGRLRQGDKNKVTIIGMISDLHKFSTGTVKLEIEDLSGSMSAIISGKRDKKLLDQTDFLALDEVIALRGGVSRSTMFVDEIIWPDVPVRPKKTTEQEVYAAFSGDLHAGSNTFLPDKFKRFISWLRGEHGNARQRELAKKTKYIFLQGDVVDGIGIYQGQEKELYVKDIYAQYDYAASFINEIPSDKVVIVCPGNHDAMRLAEPQPPLDKDYAAHFYDLPNVICLSNPAMVNIHGVNGAQGYDVLMYHGYSFDYFLECIKGLRDAGGYGAPDRLIEFLLKRRHLAPSYKSTLKIPMNDDKLLIKHVPDIFTTGHLHKAKIASYRGVLTIASSCWQKNTSFQDRVGVKAEPAKVPLVNLKTGKANLLDFN